ncbi:MAG: hypothetical protein RPU42_13295 [Candidatus Sedimenticola sp. (ex Thyasira tokunagai)]
MALVECKECSQPVSNWASKCPKCGVNNPGTRWWHILIVLVILAFVFRFAFLSDEQLEPVNTAIPTEPVPVLPVVLFTDKVLSAALNAVESEEKVEDAAWSDPQFPSLSVSIWNDGSNRNGYAEYLCQVLAEHGMTGGVVHIYDHAASLQEDYVEIGNAWCQK